MIYRIKINNNSYTNGLLNAWNGFFSLLASFVHARNERSVKAVGSAASFHDKIKAFCRLNKASANSDNYLDDKVGN
jgi:hypothetical protein